MLFLLAYWMGYDLMISTANAVTCIGCKTLRLPDSYLHASLAAYLSFDLLSGRTVKWSDRCHHLMGLATLLYLYKYQPKLLPATTNTLTVMEVGTVALNFYHDSKLLQPEVGCISRRLSPNSWGLLFLLCFITARFPIFIKVMSPHVTSRSLAAIYYSWLGLNSYWTIFIIRKFLLSTLSTARLAN